MFGSPSFIVGKELCRGVDRPIEALDGAIAAQPAR